MCGENSIQTLQNAIKVKKVSKRKPEEVYHENNALLKNVCNHIDSYSDISIDFHKEFQSLCEKYENKIKAKKLKNSNDSEMLSSHAVLDTRSVARRYGNKK